MNVHNLYLICFAAASVIHGVQVVLAAKLWRHRAGADRAAALQGITAGAVTFLFQFGNFFVAFAPTVGFSTTSAAFRTGEFIRNAALLGFPLLFSYISLPKLHTGRLLALGWYLRYPLWPWTAFAVATMAAAEAGVPIAVAGANFAGQVTLHIMLLYFVLFTAASALNRGRAEASGVAVAIRAHKAGFVAAFLAAALFILMLGGYWRGPTPFLPYIELAAMMTSVPFTIAVAYRLYQFPFMDVFVRETLTGVILLAVFLTSLLVGTAPLWVTICAILLAFLKEPLTRWVERTFMGYEESTEQQEERIGNAIRALTRLDEFGARVSEILAKELEAEWIEITSAGRPEALHRFEISGSGLSLFLGPRAGGRQYMSRQLRIARTAALQLSAHHHQLAQHELRDLTARAQMRALQAQINPHFLFNTLNVLANLIHTNPSKAERITEELAEIFRYALESTRLEWVTLDDELHFLESYLEIEKARFEDRLVYSVDVDDAIRSVKIPPMILQPLVENAIKHGIGPKVEGGEVRIAARLEADRLELVVEDTGAGPHGKSRHRGTGIGLTNVRERLEHLYGESGILRLEEGSPAGTRSVLILPQLAGAHL